jgi:predicted anti-sigma-YlaC factor YlaD
MICIQIKESVFLHAHGQLHGLPRVMVEYHLSRCPACRARAEGWATEEAQWRAVFQAEPGLNGSAASMRRAVSERIRADHPRPRTAPRPPMRRAMLALTAAALALTLSALAAFGPSVVQDIQRTWSNLTSGPVDCEDVPEIQRTPPGGTEVNPPASPPR